MNISCLHWLSDDLPVAACDVQPNGSTASTDSTEGVVHSKHTPRVSHRPDVCDQKLVKYVPLICYLLSHVTITKSSFLIKAHMKSLKCTPILATTLLITRILDLTQYDPYS